MTDRPQTDVRTILRLVLFLLAVPSIAVASAAQDRIYITPGDRLTAEHDVEMRTSHVRRLADDIVSWVLKPEAFGGGSRSAKGLTMRRLVLDVAPDGSMESRFPHYGVVHSYTLQVTGDQVVIRGRSSRESDVVEVTVTVHGRRDIRIGDVSIVSSR